MPSFAPQILSYEDLRKEADKFLDEYCDEGELPIPISEIVEFDFRMDVVPVLGLENTIGVVGYLSSDLGYVYVDKQTFDFSVERFRFTLAHEIGHYWLHDGFYKTFDIKTIEDFKAAQGAIGKHYRWFEFQANSFAGLVLVPSKPLKEVFIEFTNKATANNVSLSDIVEHPYRQRLVKAVAARFLVSEPVASRRLEKDGLLPELIQLDEIGGTPRFVR